MREQRSESQRSSIHHLFISLSALFKRLAGRTDILDAGRVLLRAVLLVSVSFFWCVFAFSIASRLGRANAESDVAMLRTPVTHRRIFAFAGENEAWDLLRGIDLPFGTVQFRIYSTIREGLSV